MTESDSSDLGSVAVSTLEGAKHRASYHINLNLAAYSMKTVMGMDGLSRADKVHLGEAYKAVIDAGAQNSSATSMSALASESPRPNTPQDNGNNTERSYTELDAQDDYELEQLFQKLGAERAWKAIARRKTKPLGRPEENHTSYLFEMTCIMKRDGDDFWDQRAISKAAREVAKKSPKGRKDISKTLIKKFNVLLVEAWANELREMIELSVKTHVQRADIQVLRDRWAPYGHLPEGAAVLAQLEDIEREIADWPTPEQIVDHIAAFEASPSAQKK
jgi:hypothetical protein